MNSIRKLFQRNQKIIDTDNFTRQPPANSLAPIDKKMTFLPVRDFQSDLSS